MTLRCVIVDDSEPFIEAARVLLEREGLSVAGTATTGADALAEVETVHPDVVLVDIFLGDESGIALARRLVENGAPTVILISSHAEADVADLIATTPAAGFLTKAELSAAAIRRIVESRSA